MRTLRQGDHGGDVKAAQTALNESGAALNVDGIFGQQTKKSVCEFQAEKNILVDGIIGPVTWDHLDVDIDDGFDNGDILEWTKVPAHVNADAYDHHNLREDVAEAYMGVYEVLDELGGKLTSSGSKRSLSADVGSNRSATSLHYLGRALDLHVYGGMHDLDNDPCVITISAYDPNRWVVWARVEHGGAETTLNAWHHPSQSLRLTSGQFINLTDLFDDYGFKSISRRSSYSKSNYGASEWWHFQHTRRLVKGETRFGDELLKLYTMTELSGTPPWRYKNALWQRDWW